MVRGRVYAAGSRPTVTVMVEPELLKQIEDFRFRHRLETKTDAMKFLWALGLEVDRPPTDEERARLNLRGG